MNCIYSDKIKNFLNLDNEKILEQFKNNFTKVYGDTLDIKQKNAWESSVRYLKDVFNDNKLHDFTIAFEYKLPLSGERIDLLILGKDKTNKPTVIVFELKGWTFAEKTEQNLFVKSDIGITIHPEYQVKNYVGKIKFSHSAADNFDLVPAVLMYNAYAKNINIEFKVPCFYKEDKQKIRDFINSNLSCPPEDSNIHDFLNGEYKQSQKLFDTIAKHFHKIKHQSYLALADEGFALSEEQLKLINEILNDLNDLKLHDKDIVYLIQGSPGSGKTLVAINLLLSALSKGCKAVLAYRNNRLINSIRSVFDSVEKGLSSTIKFYSVGPRGEFTGIAEKNYKGPKLDIVIYDEAQRMTKENIHYALQRGKITVFFYDEKQILNIEEEGYTNNFKEEAKNKGKIVKERFLQGVYRVEGGKQYHEFVEILLKNPNLSKEYINGWKDSYDFKVFDSIEELILALEKKRDNFRVALIASFTESPGDSKNKTSNENLRIGYPLPSGFDLYKNLNKKIYWLMDPKSEYVNFWVKGESNKLEKCASIYGCQGFETDFAGIIWGRDFVYCNGKWVLGDNCEDGVGGEKSLKNIMRLAKNGNEEMRKNAISLLINRYRIFLTRGIKGTYIFCEDIKTANFLKSLSNLLNRF